MDGAAPAPASAPHIPSIPAAFRSKLSYYAGAGLGVLGPAGWHCVGLSGSNGASLFVTPAAHTVQQAYDLKGITGPAIQLSYLNGQTSGRFEVARIEARLFPGKRDFVRRVIDEHIWPHTDFPFGPPEDDGIMKLSDTAMAFITPPGKTGTGTMSRLAPDDLPIYGVALLTTEESVVVLDARLPAKQRRLYSAIQQALRARTAPPGP